MRNYKFRFSDMIPNAWLYKLKDMRHKGNKTQNMPKSTTRSHQQPPRATPKPLPIACQPKLLPNRTSYYYSSRAEADGHLDHAVHSKAESDAEFLLLDPPRRSKKRGKRNPSKASASTAKLVTSSVSADCSCRSWKTESIPEFPLPPSTESPPCPRDYYIDGDQPNLKETDVAGGLHRDAVVICSARSLAQKLEDLDIAPERDLPPILTKPAKKDAEDVKLEHRIRDDKNGSYQACNPAVRQSKNHTRRSPPGLHRLRMRANSPRLASRKLQSHHRDWKRGATATAAAAMQQRKGFSGSFAVVKSSSDPERDFRDSMVEMIVENDIRTSKDLEELLACYLLLNSKEYHDVIVEVFEQLWFDMITNVKL